MRAASKATLTHAREVLRDALVAGSTPAMRVAEDLFGLSDIARTDVRLRGAFTDPAREVADRVALAHDLLAPHVRPETLEVVDALVSGHWSDPMDLHDAFEVLGIWATLDDAMDHDAIATVEEELFQVREFLGGNRELRNDFSDLGRGTRHDRADLAQTLFGPHVSVWTMRLLRRAVGRTSHGRLLATLRRLEEHAAEVRQRRLVSVVAAAPMTTAQVERLRRIVSRRIGSDVTVNVAIDPSLVGGFRLLTGDTAVDSSVSTQVDGLKLALAR